MPPFLQPDISRLCMRKQQGVALMVMLVIMIIGAATLLVGSLASSAIKIERGKTTANALAQAKEALIGYAVSDANRPGELPCPDVDDDGKIVMNVDYVGSNCTSPIGRLPWKALGLPELRDGAGEHLWYTVSKTFAANGSNPMNSETQGTLTVSGTTTASNVIAIVFAPGAAIQSENRSPSVTATCATLPLLNGSSSVAKNLCATNYLEGNNAASSSWTTPNLNYQSADPSSTFNDRMIFITHKDLMPLVEKRIAREVRSCLDGYASAHSSTYPWAAPVSDTTYSGATDTLFGRLPANATIYSAEVQKLLDLLAALQLAFNNFKTNPASTTYQQAVYDAGLALSNEAKNNATISNSSPLGQDAINQAQNAGDYAYKNVYGGVNTATFETQLQSQIDQALVQKFDQKYGVTPGGGWPANCTIFSATYWHDSSNNSIWRDLVFYQIADGYKPGGSGSCGTSPNTCLAISGSGNTVSYNGTYRAAVIVAGEMLSGQSPRTPATNPPNTYLANTTSEKSSDPAFVTNAHDSTSLTPATTFITYKPSDPYYQNVNDLVLCLDGGVNCK